MWKRKSGRERKNENDGEERKSVREEWRGKEKKIVRQWQSGAISAIKLTITKIVTNRRPG